jgi:peptidoglycan/xylan/chitin deacetylase (PgdA/CDA1 family)
VSAAAGAAVVAPFAFWLTDPVSGTLVLAVVAVLAAAGVFALVRRAGAAGPALLRGLLGLAGAAAAVLVLSVVPIGVITVVTAVALGGCLGLVARSMSTGVGRGPRPVALVACALPVVLAGGLVVWTGANDPTVAWFGPIVRHGDRGERRVALTFDDGPATSSIQVADLLDAAGVRGTFFVVGKAVDARPDLAVELTRRGHLLANHSYHHDYWRWLDPRYPELARTQQAIRAATGECPAFFRPPHGQRTPFMAREVDRRGLDTVLWDVSAADWTVTDGAEIARRVLERVQPGSVVLLHDAIDGRPDADRSALLDALPRILEGLNARGLTPVRLDELLGRPGLQATAACDDLSGG